MGPSFAKHMLEHSHLYNLTENEMASLASAFFIGGSDTVSRLLWLKVVVEIMC